MLKTYEQNGKIKIIATIISVIVVGGTVITADKLKSANASSLSSVVSTNSTAANTAQGTSTSSATSSTNSTSSTTYKDGTYTSSVSYNVPHSQESISVTAQLTGGVISSVTIQNSEGDRVSASYQEDFASAYKSYVVGKSISGLSFDVISGASDTTSGFKQALSQIATQAQA